MILPCVQCAVLYHEMQENMQTWQACKSNLSGSQPRDSLSRLGRDIWQYLGTFLAVSGWRPGMPRNILQHTGQPQNRERSSATCQQCPGWDVLPCEAHAHSPPSSHTALPTLHSKPSHGACTTPCLSTPGPLC